MDIREIIRADAKKLILANYQANNQSHIPLSWPHYQDQILWESGANAIIAQELGMTDLAKNEILRVLQFQQPEGWIPNVMGKQKQNRNGRMVGSKLIGLKDLNHPQWWSSYSQPSILARTLDWINEPTFTQQVFPKIVKHYLYFIQHRDPDNDGLVSLIHPHETSRDASPDFDKMLDKILLPGLIGRKLNLKLHYLSIIKLNWYLRTAKWDPELILAKHIFDFEDPQFISVWIEELRTLAKLCPEFVTARLWESLASQAKDALIELCWDKNDKFFYPLDWQNRKIKSPTIAGLFPLIIRDLPKEMADSLVEHLTDSKEFWTDYPIPSVSKKHPRFDPEDNSGHLRGASWIYWNWHIVTGLLRHGYREIAEKIIENDFKKIEINRRLRGTGWWEKYHPFTGDGLREESKNFSTSALVVSYPTLILKEGS